MLKNYKNFLDTLLEKIENDEDVNENGDGTTKTSLTNNVLSVEQKEINLKVSKKIRQCLLIIHTKYGFFANLLYKLKIKQSMPGDGVNTMATDSISLIYNPNWVMKLTQDEILFVLCHEVMHCALMHMFRRGDKDHETWNSAADYAINLLVEGIGKMPDKGLYDVKYKNMSTEQIYEYLINNPSEKPKTKGGDPGDYGPGDPNDLPQSDIRNPGSLSDKGEEILPSQTGQKSELEEASKGKLEEIWKEIVTQAAKTNIGSKNENFNRWIKTLSESKVNWKVELKKFVANIFNKLGTVIPNRRFVGRNEFIWGPKKLRSDYDTVVVAIDTSGSINDNLLSEFAVEIEALSKSHNIKEIIVIWCDSDIPENGIQKFGKHDKFALHKLAPKGGGGTSFKPPFYWINNNLIKNGKTPAFIIYFTDAEGEAPKKNEVLKYADNVIWVITGTASTKHLEFGKKIHLPK